MNHLHTYPKPSSDRSTREYSNFRRELLGLFIFIFIFILYIVICWTYLLKLPEIEIYLYPSMDTYVRTEVVFIILHYFSLGRKIGGGSFRIEKRRQEVGILNPKTLQSGTGSTIFSSTFPAIPNPRLWGGGKRAGGSVTQDFHGQPPQCKRGNLSIFLDCG